VFNSIQFNLFIFKKYTLKVQCDNNSHILKNGNRRQTKLLLLIIITLLLFIITRLWDRLGARILGCPIGHQVHGGYQIDG